MAEPRSAITPAVSLPPLSSLLERTPITESGVPHPLIENSSHSAILTAIGRVSHQNSSFKAALLKEQQKGFAASQVRDRLAVRELLFAFIQSVDPNVYPPPVPGGLLISHVLCTYDDLDKIFQELCWTDDLDPLHLKHKATMCHCPLSSF